MSPSGRQRLRRHADDLETAAAPGWQARATATPVEFRNARDNYYTAGDQIHGHWHGQLARAWGLSGEVDQTHFERLAEGRHPITDEALVRHQTARTYTNASGDRVEIDGASRRGGTATFCAGNLGGSALAHGAWSVAMTGLREAHRSGCRASAASTNLRRMSRHDIGRNHLAEDDGQGGFAAGWPEHDSARLVDGYASSVQLHSHAVFFNLTETAEGETRALQPRELAAMQAASVIAGSTRSELATHLTELGYEIERGQSGQPEIRGYTPEHLGGPCAHAASRSRPIGGEEQRGSWTRPDRRPSHTLSEVSITRMMTMQAPAPCDGAECLRRSTGASGMRVRRRAAC